MSGGLVVWGYSLTLIYIIWDISCKLTPKKNRNFKMPRSSILAGLGFLKLNVISLLIMAL